MAKWLADAEQTVEFWRLLTFISWLIIFRLLWILPDVRESRRQLRHWYNESATRLKTKTRKRK